MKIAIALLTALLVISSSGCVVTPPARRLAVVEVDVRPPPLRVVAVPAPRRGYIWVGGFWRWDGRRYAWVDGRWLRERRGWTWAPAHWEEHRGRWHFEPGEWVRG